MTDVANGKPKFTLSLGKKKDAGPQKPKPKPRRTHGDLGGSDNEDEFASKHEVVSHFDQAAGGAILETKSARLEAGAPIIKAIPNRDWREGSRRKRQKTQPDGQSLGQKAVDTSDQLGTKSSGFGLIVPEKPTTADAVAEQQDEKQVTPELEVIPKTDDERALDALLGNEPKSTLILEPVENEEQAFERDFKDAPESASLDEYAAMPIESFGRAYLLGFGWKEGDAIGKNRSAKIQEPRSIARRPVHLGIGAKEDKAAGVELGAWGKAAARGKQPTIYTPVTLKNTKTGEELTEEQLKEKLAQQKQLPPDTEALKSDREGGRKRDGSDRNGRRSSRERGSRHDSDRSRKRRDYESGSEIDGRDRGSKRGDDGRDRRRGKEYDRDYDDRRRDRDRDYSRERTKYRDGDRDSGRDSDRRKLEKRRDNSREGRRREGDRSEDYHRRDRDYERRRR